MAIELETPTEAALPEALEALRRWQRDDAPLQLHPGDVGWLWRFGVAATAAALRSWRRDGALAAVGMLDGEVLRVAIDPELQGDAPLARAIAADAADPSRGVLPDRADAAVEAPVGACVLDELGALGWGEGEPWALLRRDLEAQVEPHGLRVVVVGPELAPERTAVHREGFARASFTVERWHAMASGPLYADARCLLAVDERGEAAAAITVWSAGPGRPGLIEPLAVHPAQRGRGIGRAITVAGAAALRELGSSAALVATPISNGAAVATYRSAGFAMLGERRDRCRGA
ncbi:MULTISPECIES: GNAT family N-acetyltransferase [Agrococcus]|uniref:N-acetyltransferase domain-containing protein n=1 Tax=Agrococcus pavilionensis RW1 TaxID=1330458 RepID=U1LSZ6_9MICO|nr:MULTISPECIES: GNAT family N-acetyltransferase [Agrococcus]ERG65227.1 hypothetical protein L332_12355 [Agrococcus pavilionensis RW1]MBO1770017.1 GNAT family N-acetyltransferase [Agrococcus sp. TF02-05]